MPAPTLTLLPPAPTRANPATFAARADTFMTALPTFATQINALVSYWNTELDTTAFINRNLAQTMTGTLTFAAPPIIFASATSGDQPALTLGKGTVQRQAIRIANNGSINIVPLNGATAQLRINNQEVYHNGRRPTPAEVGALPVGDYTAVDIRTKLLTVDGAGSGVDADLLDGQHGAYYLSASNLNAGTVPDARLPNDIVRNTRRVNSGDGLNGGAAMTGDINLAVDATVARRNQINTFDSDQFFSSGNIHIDAGPSSSLGLHFRTTGGSYRGLIWAPAASDLVRFRSYVSGGDSYKEFYFNGDSGVLSSPGFAGDGSLLAGLNAGALTTGTVPDARLPSTAVRTSLTLTAGDGLQGGGNMNGNRTFAVDSTVVRTGRQISAGNGLSGGGNLSADRAFALGTPGSITADSPNAVSANSHTHYIDRTAVLELISRLTIGEVGSYGAFRRNVAGTMAPGATCPGSQLIYSAFGSATSGSSPSGTWRCLGYASSVDGVVHPNNASLFLRIA